MSELEQATKPWREFLKEMTQKEIGKAIKSGYRKTANKAAKLVREEMHRSGLKVKGDVKSLDKSVRVRIYPKGGGFLVTTKPRGKQGVHRNRFGKLKPVAMWASEGTTDRYLRRRFKKRNGKPGTGYRGAMRNYGFVDKATTQAFGVVEQDLGKELETAVMKAAKKAGLTD